LNRLTLKGVVFSGSAADLRALRAQFQCDHYIILPKLIELDLLATILKRIESAPSVQKEDDGVIAESIIDDPHTYNHFLFLLNMPEFQRLFQRITGCHRVADFQGRNHRLNSTTGDRIVWHTDVYDHRVVTFSLKLTAQEYRGGTLLIRCRGSDEFLHEVRSTGPRDALLMRDANKLFHRVLPVEGDVPRTALAGSYRCEKENVNFHTALRKASRASPAKEATSEVESGALKAMKR
jgi:hypothetical protein